jgi:uncharacterized protein RhaS with RHS repeats
LNHHSWYNPNIGRWMSEDPIGFNASDANLHRYVENQPTTRLDPSGLINDYVWAVADGAQVGLRNVGQKLWTPIRWTGVTTLVGAEGYLKRRDAALKRDWERTFNKGPWLEGASKGAAYTGAAAAYGAGAVGAWNRWSQWRSSGPSPTNKSGPSPFDDPEHVFYDKLPPDPAIPPSHIFHGEPGFPGGPPTVGQ